MPGLCATLPVRLQSQQPLSSSSIQPIILPAPSLRCRKARSRWGASVRGDYYACPPEPQEGVYAHIARAVTARFPNRERDIFDQVRTRRNRFDLRSGRTAERPKVKIRGVVANSICRSLSVLFVAECDYVRSEIVALQIPKR